MYRFWHLEKHFFNHFTFFFLLCLKCLQNQNPSRNNHPRTSHNLCNRPTLFTSPSIYLHVCYLVLLPVEALHLVFLQLLSGLHILVIVTLTNIEIQGHPSARIKLVPTPTSIFSGMKLHTAPFIQDHFYDKSSYCQASQLGEKLTV